MLDSVIALSLKHRWPVLLAALALAVAGAYRLASMPVDVFPDLNRPTVTVMTEAAGLAPEEVEVLVTRPVESLLIGATGVRRVRSSSGVGLSVVWVEFDWGTDIYRDRQIVGEKLQLARARLPIDAAPALAPISSIMGEIMLVGLYSTAGEAQAMRVRTLGEFAVRYRLLAVEGVSQVTVMGGVLQQYQIITSPERLAGQGVTLQQLVEAAEKANAVVGGGILDGPHEERLIRISGASLTLDDVAATPVLWQGRRAVRIGDVADVRFGGPIRRGDAGLLTRDMKQETSVVMLSVQKQPGANTLALTPKIDEALDQLERELPADIRIERHVFRQADFIRRAVDNVIHAVRDGALWVVLVLCLFLANIRTGFVTLVALPLSVLITVLVFSACGVGINTMTLGGIAVAVGELVDDAIVDVENIYRRLKENRTSDRPLPPLQVIYRASSEVRNSIVFATLIVCLVVLPLFAMSGLEGRMFAPLGLAYVTSLAASLVVSLTVTPALASLVLPRAKFLDRRGDPWLLRGLKWLDEKLIRWSLRHPRKIIVAVAVLAFGSKLVVFGMGSEFLPEFNEGTLTVNVRTPPGTSLTESRRVALRVEALLAEVPEVESIARRTGRAEADEHAEGVNSSDLEVQLNRGRPYAAVLAEVRERLSRLPNVAINVGQPISHRLDHVLSGVRAQIAIKIFGEELRELATAAYDVQGRLSRVPGVVDLQVEPLDNVKQIRLEVDRRAAAEVGLAPGDVARLLETAYKGRVVSTVLDRERSFDLVVWYDEASRGDRTAIGQTILDTPSGRKVALSQVARVIDARGPSLVQHEHGRRRVAVACNVQGRDLGRVVAEIDRELEPIREQLRTLGGGYRIEISGQHEAQREAGRLLFWLFGAALVGVFLLLWKCLDSAVAATLVLAINLPLAALGSIVALLVINRPESELLMATPWWRWPWLWAGATTLSIAHWVGFITLVGIVSRNGIMMISHYIHLQQNEGVEFGDELIVRGTLERLAPVLMTALTAGIGLVPLALGAGQPGKEILHPLAIVVIGGLLDATLMDQIVTPAAYKLFGRRIAGAAES